MEAKGSPRGVLKAPAGVYPRSDKYVVVFMNHSTKEHEPSAESAIARRPRLINSAFLGVLPRPLKHVIVFMKSHKIPNCDIGPEISGFVLPISAIAAWRQHC